MAALRTSSEVVRNCYTAVRLLPTYLKCWSWSCLESGLRQTSTKGHVRMGTNMYNCLTSQNLMQDSCLVLQAFRPASGIDNFTATFVTVLHNRHEKVQEASINLIGRIGECQAYVILLHVPLIYSFYQPIVVQNSWQRENGCASASSCCQLLRLYREVLGSSRCPFCSPHQFAGARTQSRVCSTIAITIVLETCGPFTCIPAILNEYRTAELNVRTGCQWDTLLSGLYVG